MTRSNSLPLQSPEDQLRQKNALQIITVQFVATVAATIFLLFLNLRTNFWQLYVGNVALVILDIVYFVTLRMVRRGRVLDAVRITITASAVVMLSGVLLFTGMGWIIALSMILMISINAFQTLPAKSARQILIVTVGLALVAVALDRLNLPYRLSLPTMTAFVPAIVAFVAVVMALFGLFSSRGQLAKLWQSSIRNRLILIVSGSALIPVVLVSIILGWSTYTQVRSALIQNAFDKLAAVETIKANQVESYLAERRGDMSSLQDTMSSMFREARAKLDAINALKRDQIVRLFQTWDADVRDVAADPGVVLGMRDLAAGMQQVGAMQVRNLYLGQPSLIAAQDGSSYSTAHLQQQGFFNGYISIHGYEDAFLIDPAGNVVYSVHKTDAFGTNLLTGPYKDTNLSKLYKNLLTAQAGNTYIADVASFEGAYAMFIGAPIYDGSTFVGILAYRLPLSAINNLMTERTGQGETGETFLVAMEEDGRITYRSDRPIAGNGEFVIGYDLTNVASQSIRNALEGKTGGGLIVGSTGEAVVNSYGPLNVKGLKWAVFARVTAAEALSPTSLANDKDFLTNYKESYGYYDIFLIEPKGFVFYTVNHEADFGTNILTGEYKDTALGSLIAEVLESKSYEFFDFTNYGPSGIPAAFHAVPVLDEQGNVQFIIATQASHININKIMSETTGLGETGETFLVGLDQLRRTETRFLEQLGAESTVLNPQYKVDTVASRSVLSGKSGQATFNDYRGVPVMAVWSPIQITEEETSRADVQFWGLIAKVDVAEALAPVDQLARAVGLVIGLAVLAIGALSVFLGTRFAIGFVSPILTLTETAAQVAAGNMDLTVNVQTSDEIGTLSGAFNTMTSKLRDLVNSLEERVAARTKDLATVAEVSTATGTILETQKLLQAVVDLSKERFELYHAHIYLLDEAGENLVLTAGAGEPGRIMTAEKRFIPLNREQSVVARAAREAKGVVVNDVTEAPDFLPNPLLPETRAEMAVPMIVGGKVIGVFDVQSEKVGRFTEADVNVKTTLAAQVATSIQNVRSFERAKTQAELESLVNSIGQKIQRSTSVEDTLQIAVREVGLALGASRVSARLQSTRKENNNAN